MQHLSTVSSLWALKPFAIGFGFAEPAHDQPHRKSLEAPADSGLFVKPIKQSFIRNPRLSPMTRMMLTLLAGWSGHGAPIDTTLGILGRHLSRSARQVQRYLRDAIEEGYLTMAYTKDHIGRITGLRLRLNRKAIYHETRSTDSSRHCRAHLPQYARRRQTNLAASPLRKPTPRTSGGHGDPQACYGERCSRTANKDSC